MPTRRLSIACTLLASLTALGACGGGGSGSGSSSAATATPGAATATPSSASATPTASSGSAPAATGDVAAWCAASKALDDSDVFNALDKDATPGQVKAAFSQGRAMAEDVRRLAPAAIRPDVDVVVDAIGKLDARLAALGYDPTKVAGDADLRAVLEDKGVATAGEHISTFVDQHCTSTSSSATTTAAAATTTVAASSAAVAGFRSATATYRAAASTALAANDAARRAADLPAAKASNRSLRDALFAYDGAVRALALPADARGAANTLLTSIGLAIAGLDATQSAADPTAFTGYDQQIRSALQAVDAGITATELALGLPSSSTTAAATTTTTAAPARSTQPNVEPNAAAYVAGGQVTDVRAWRDMLVLVALNNTSGPGGRDGSPEAEAWRAAFPSVLTSGKIVGSSIEAPANGISGFAVVDLKQDKLHAVLMFAAKGADGRCAGALIGGDDAPTRPLSLDVPAGQPCTGAQVLKLAAG